MIKNIVFDIGGVLVDFAPDRLLMDEGMPKERVDRVMKATILSSWWPELDRGFIPESEIIEGMKAKYPEAAEDVDFLFSRDLRNLVKSREYAHDWLKGLRDRGYRVFLLTNYPADIFKLHWDTRFSFTDQIDGLVVSAEVKKIKPDPDIYRILLDKYSLDAAECVFIDDRAENAAAARHVGMNAIHFTSYENACEKLNSMLA